MVKGTIASNLREGPMLRLWGFGILEEQVVEPLGRID
jgi:hypothetical protein